MARGSAGGCREAAARECSARGGASAGRGVRTSSRRSCAPGRPRRCPWLSSERRKAVAAQAGASWIAKYSVSRRRVGRQVALPPTPRSCRARRKKSSVRAESALTVRARFVNCTRPRSGRSRMSGGWPIGPGIDQEVHAVLVEGERGDRRRVPPVEVVSLPRGMRGGAVEPRRVAHQVPGDARDPARLQRIGQLVEGRRLRRVVAGRERRIAATVEDQVAAHGRRRPPAPPRRRWCGTGSRRGSSAAAVAATTSLTSLAGTKRRSPFRSKTIRPRGSAIATPHSARSKGGASSRQFSRQARLALRERHAAGVRARTTRSCGPGFCARAAG